MMYICNDTCESLLGGLPFKGYGSLLEDYFEGESSRKFQKIIIS